MPKPPPITITPTGFEATKRMGEDDGPPAYAQIHLRKIAALPPFQAFITSREQPAQGMQADHFAYGRALAAIGRTGAPAFFREYEAWHAAQGCWPNETPYGVVKDAPPSAGRALVLGEEALHAVDIESVRWVE